MPLSGNEPRRGSPPLLADERSLERRLENIVSWIAIFLILRSKGTCIWTIFSNVGYELGNFIERLRNLLSRRIFRRSDTTESQLYISLCHLQKDIYIFSWTLKVFIISSSKFQLLIKSYKSWSFPARNYPNLSYLDTEFEQNTTCPFHNRDSDRLFSHRGII